MKTTFIQTRFSEKYLEIKNKIKKNHQVVDYLKRGFLAIGFFVSFGVYVCYVSASTTEGYFLKQATNALEKQKFDLNIVNLQIAQNERDLRNSMNIDTSNKAPVIDLQNSVVVVPVAKELTYMK